jgi:hypothetical protein
MGEPEKASGGWRRRTGYLDSVQRGGVRYFITSPPFADVREEPEEAVV